MSKTTLSFFSALSSDPDFQRELRASGASRLLAKLARQDSIDKAPASEAAASEDLAASPATLRAALSHSFLLSELGASPNEANALLANAEVLTSGGRQRLRLCDRERGRLLDDARGREPLKAMLAAFGEHDRFIFSMASADEETMASAWLRSFLRGAAPDLGGLSAAQLRAALLAREALRETATVPRSVPDVDECRRRWELEELLEPLRLLVGQSGPPGTPDRFAGRVDELTELRSFVDVLASRGAVEMAGRAVSRARREFAARFGWGEPRLMVISARGGLGKSTLVAKFVLDHAVARGKFPFAYLDFDRATIQPRSPHQLLIETVRQIALSFPEHVPHLAELRQRLRAELAGKRGGIDLQKAGILFGRHIRDILSTTGADTFLLVLDTMERVQSDPEAMRGVVRLLSALIVDDFPELAVVAAGRADIPELTDSETLRWSVKTLPLKPLSVADAVDMVDRLGGSLVSGWSRAWSRRIAGSRRDPEVRREPLSLRIAVEIVRNAPPVERPSIVDEIGTLGERADDRFVGRLYEHRILNHIEDTNARRLAWPGLVVRRITREIARTIIGPLCKLAPEQVDPAFDRLGREVWIVTREDGGETLRHHPDLRARTLPLMRQRDADIFCNIASAMVEYYENRAGGGQSPDAELAYYRLLRGDDPAFLDETWSDELAAALDPARIDFEPGSPASNYLEAKLATRLLPRGFLAKLPDHLAWEHVARAGSALRKLDDERVDWRVVDLARRSQSIAYDWSSAILGVLIKAGCWSRLVGRRWNVGPVIEADFQVLALLMSALDDASINSRSIVDDSWFYEFVENSVKASDVGAERWQHLAFLLYPMRLRAPEVYDDVDRMLDYVLSSHSDWRMGYGGALRIAAIFGEKCRPAAVRRYVKGQLESGRRKLAISAAELSMLVDGPRSDVEQIEKQTESLRKAARDWLTGGKPKRIDDPEIVGPAYELIRIASDVADAGDPLAANVLRRVFSARMESWIVPVGYLLARSIGPDGVPQHILETASEYARPERSSILGFTLYGKPTRSLRDPVRLARFVDEAGALPHLLMQIGDIDLPDGVREDLSVMLDLMRLWRKRLDSADGTVA